MNKKEKKKQKIKVTTKNKIIAFFTIILLLFLCTLTFQKVDASTKKVNFENSLLSFSEKNGNTIFSINKIVFFSSCDSKNKTSSRSNFTLENLYTYTDMALFINHHSEENTLENTLKEVSIQNLKFNTIPQEGTPKLYYKSLNNFATSGIPETQAIENTLNFTISSESSADLSSPTLYNNCANPITLTCILENIKNDYTITDTSNPITYNGSLLKRCNVPISSLSCSLSFDVLITNNQNEKFKTSIYLNLPFEDDSNSIYEGTITVKKDTNYLFYRYE